MDKQSHSSLADMLLEDFSELPKKGKTDLDEFAVINVGPSVVPNPYVPTFRVYAYNATRELSSDLALSLDVINVHDLQAANCHIFLGVDRHASRRTSHLRRTSAVHHL